MKKFLFTVILLIVAIGSVAFAEHIGDFQFRVPGFCSSKSEGASERTTTIDFGIATYQNWFVIPDILGVGFMIETDMGFKKKNDNRNTGVNMLIGPSVSATLGKVVRLELGMGLNIGYSAFSYKFEMPSIYSYGSYKNKFETRTNLWGAGFGLDFTAVFLPKARFSPLVGLNFSTLAGHGKAKTDVYRYYGSKPNFPDVDVDVNSNSFKMFIGGCFNFGKR